MTHESEPRPCEPHAWNDDITTYQSFIGTAQLDQKITGDISLRSIAGLDQDRWQIVGFEIGGGENYHGLDVIAVERGFLPEDGPVEVTHFRIHDVDPYEALRSITHSFGLRMRIARLQGREITITALGDSPEQPE